MNTIDSKGNIVPRRYGVSRWDYPKRYDCSHDNCDKAAKILSRAGKAHNCCGEH